MNAHLNPVWLLIISFLPVDGNQTTALPLPDVLKICDPCIDMSRVTWAHGVNSRELLNSYINDTRILMLEADVSTGRVLDTLDDLPIMAHPPDNTSDLSLLEFLEVVLDSNNEGARQGIKLDFKDITAAKEGMTILREKRPLIHFPLWVNADIIKGSLGQNKTPVDAHQFLSLSKQLLPQATLSIGWTTGYDPDEPDFYTFEMMEEMIGTLEEQNVTQPVTFPIRASYVHRSLKQLKHLLESVPGSTLTVFTSSGDFVDIRFLVELQNIVGFDKVYYDLPKDQMKIFKFIQLLEL